MYEETPSHNLYKIDDKGERTLLCNFTARITHETRHVDGRTSELILTMEGKQSNPANEEEPIIFSPVDVPASAYAGLGWVLNAWGASAVIQPGSGTKDDIRTAIQTKSTPIQNTVYRHIGWTTIKKKRAYIHAGGAINEKGNDPTVQVLLPPELGRYRFDYDPKKTKEAFDATLRLANVAPKPISWTLLAATFAPLISDIDFAVHVTGRTGTFKSELLSLFQSHYGPGMDARHLPGSWSSTANALEAQAYLVKNAAFTIDDFVPAGTSWQIKSYQTTADKLIRAQGNQAGRARLTDTSSLQQTMYPRGLILSTGEDTPEGHSIRARMMILELSPGDVDTEDLTAAQLKRPIYNHTTAAFIRWIAATSPDTTKAVETLRQQYVDMGHNRTPSMLARLVVTIATFLEWAKQSKLLTTADHAAATKEAIESLKSAAGEQKQWLEDANPADQFLATLRHALTAGLAHVRTLNGGIPRSPELLGWTQENTMGDVPTYRSHGPCLGWAAWNEDELYLDVVLGYNTVKKFAGTELALSKQTLLKRLKEETVITRTDEARQRNTIRITAEGHPRNVFCMSLSKLLQLEESPL